LVYQIKEKWRNAMKKIIWLAVSLLMVLSLLIASCGKGEEETGGETPTGEMVKVTLTKDDGTTMTKTVEKPKYGGTATWVGITYSHFDPFVNLFMFAQNKYIANEQLMCGDWKRGPAGTDETGLIYGYAGQMKNYTGWLAESWDLPDSETIVYHIRKGVHWFNKPPVNGRELTADDVVWTINRAFSTQTSYWYINYANAGNGPISVKALDKYTVEVKVSPDMQGELLIQIGDEIPQFPPEPTEVYGDMEDWKNLQGTSAWMLTDYVSGTSVTYSKNPDYWQYDPILPEYKLPYPDKIVELFIADASTQLAAFRTGQTDYNNRVTWEDMEVLKEQHPELLVFNRGAGIQSQLWWRVDKPELPFSDIRVRQALNMAVNKQEMLDDYYEGHADLLAYPVCNVKDFEAYYIPLEEEPKEVQDLFTYNPEKAKELLKEAGYPDGFTFKVTCASSATDFLSILKEYYKTINVNMEMEVLEQSVFSSVWFGREYEQAVYSMNRGDVCYYLWDVQRDQLWDQSLFEDARTEEAVQELKVALGRNDAEVVRIMRDINPYLLEQCHGLWLPGPDNYCMCWPWFKNFHGEWSLGSNAQERCWTYLWIDQDLKKSMGY
jgi:peptide/nickel transport system substrate-binding protein